LVASANSDCRIETITNRKFQLGSKGRRNLHNSGIFVGLWGLLGALQLLDLWLGLYNAKVRVPWTNFFLLVLRLIFSVHRHGVSLSFETLLVTLSDAAEQCSQRLPAAPLSGGAS
jgi:hypothetical protein